MNYLLAVSGGVDSIVLLDLVTKRKLLGPGKIIVAHFDHGIRPDSAEDELFVRALAKQHNLMYLSKREELGPDASEELARNRRYEFLRGRAYKYNAKIVTAHHADDVMETIAINVSRGTGWRGVAVLDSDDIERPLLSVSKNKLLKYANDNGLEWREDSTNSDTKYLRNKIRQELNETSVDDVRTFSLYRNRQVAIKRIVEDEIKSILKESLVSGRFSRYVFIMVPQVVGCELLRYILIGATGVGATRPQLERALIAIKTYGHDKRYELSGIATIYFTSTEFIIE